MSPLTQAFEFGVGTALTLLAIGGLIAAMLRGESGQPFRAVVVGAAVSAVALAAWVAYWSAIATEAQR